MQKGFTLVEIIISIAILAVIASLGLFISMDFFKSYSFRSEQSVIVTLLQNTRSQSLNNIDQVRHGVHFQGSPLRYTIFECPVGTPQCSSYVAGSSDLTTNSSYNITMTSPALPFDIIFDQLNGDCVSCASPVNIQISDGVKNYIITINNEGQISW
jgi:prepilin-type N-terminal cleavage/methylation domain-containing protein